MVRRFFVQALGFLILGLALWYLARDWVVMPAAWLAGWVMESFTWVNGSELNHISAALLTHIRILDASGRAGVLAPEVNVLAYCYGLPLLFALLAGAHAKGLWWKLLVGGVVLVPFQAWGVCFSWLVQITTHADQTAARTGFSSVHLNVFGLCYQIGFLMLPVLAPLSVWLFFERQFVASVVMEGAFMGWGETQQAAPPPRDEP